MKQKIAKILLCFNLLLPGLYTSSVPGFSAVEVVADEQPSGTVRSGVAILITFLLANGMRFIGHFDEIEAGIEELWDDFSAATGNTVSLMNLTAGAVLHLGYLRLNSTVQNAMAAFQSWLVAQKDIPDTGITDIAQGAGAVAYLQIAQNSTDGIIGSTSAAVWQSTQLTEEVRGILQISPTNKRLYLVATASGITCKYKSRTTVDAVLNSAVTIGGTTYYYAEIVPSGNTGIGVINAWYDSLYPSMQVNAFSVNGAVDMTWGESSGGIADTTVEAETLDLIDGWNLANDQARLLDIAVLQALVNRIGLTLDNIDDLVDDIPALYDIPWSTDFPDDPTLVDTPDDTIPWVDIPDSTVPADPSSDIPDTPAQQGEYKILGLERVFPFSLPFDLIALVRVLRASPETPEFDVPMYDPVEGEVITQHVNLHQFDSWAAIMRTGSTLFFLAGLILITRNLIRG